MIDDDGSGNEASLTASTMLLPLHMSLLVTVKPDVELMTDDLFLPDDCKSTRLTVGVSTQSLLALSTCICCEPESDVVVLVLFLWRSRRLRRPRLDVSLDALTAELSTVNDVVSLGASLGLSTDVLSTSINHHNNSITHCVSEVITVSHYTLRLRSHYSFTLNYVQ